MHDILPKTEPHKPTHGGHKNVIDEFTEESALRYIEDQVIEGLGTSKAIIYGAIYHLCERSSKKHSLWRWFQKWDKSHGDLHAIKTKSIASIRQIIHTKEDAEQ